MLEHGTASASPLLFRAGLREPRLSDPDRSHCAGYSVFALPPTLPAAPHAAGDPIGASTAPTAGRQGQLLRAQAAAGGEQSRSQAPQRLCRQQRPAHPGVCECRREEAKAQRRNAEQR